MSTDTIPQVDDDMLKTLLDRGKARVKDQIDNRISFRDLGARKLTEDEINDLLTVIPAPACADPLARELVWASRIRKVRDDLKEVELIPRALPIYKEWLRKEAILLDVEPGTNAGGNAADNISAKTTQNTLNTRHNPGARQAATGGIKGNQRLLNLHKRAPLMVMAFRPEAPQTFYSIMKEIRPKYVGLRVGKLIVPGSLRARVFAVPEGVEGIQLDNRPSWYQYFSPPNADVCLEAKIRRDVLYMHKVTVPAVVRVIEAVDAKWRVLYSPLSSGEDVTFHIYATGAPKRIGGEEDVSELTARMTSVTGEDSVGTELETDLDEDDTPIGGGDDEILISLERVSATGALFRLYRVLPGILVKGKPNVTDVVPFFIPVMDVVDEEDKEGIVYLSPTKSKLHGIGAERVARLLAACGIASTVLDPLRVQVDMPAYERVKAPTSITTYLDGLPEPQTRDEVAERTLLSGQVLVSEETPDTFTIQDPATTPAVISALRRVGLKPTSLAGGGYKVEYPEPTIIGRVKSFLKMARADMVEYERLQRQKRYAGDKTISLLRPLTELDKASVVHYAEINGGSLYEFVDADIVDDVPIDVRYSFSNNVREMLQMLGIEGAFSFLMTEIHDTYAGSGAQLEATTVLLAARMMTYRGYLIPFSRDGIVSQDAGPLSRAVVQTPMVYFSRFAINQRSDKIQTQLSRVATGREIGGGTSIVKVKPVVTAVGETIPEGDETAPVDELDELGAGAVPVGRHYILDVDQIGVAPELARRTK